MPGIEFSAEYEGASLHVLAYWIDPANEALRDELRRLTDTRFRRGELMIEKLQELGYPIEFERVREIAGGDTIARPHVAQAMVEAGIVPNEKAAFTEEFIADGGSAWVPKHALHPLDALTLIAGAGGVCVLAHPGMWKGAGSVPDELIEAMAAGGMAGLEVDHPDHDEAQRAKYRAMAERLDLVPTGASDCHGRRYDPVRLGSETTDAERVDRAAPSRRPLTGREMVAVSPTLEMVFFDIGGVLYDDTIYARAINTALRALGASFTDAGVRRRLSRGARRTVGIVPRAAGRRFLGPDADMAALEAEASTHWAYPPEALHDDVRPCLTSLAGQYRLGIIANQPSSVKDALRRDGLAGSFEVWGVSDDVGPGEARPRVVRARPS